MSEQKHDLYRITGKMEVKHDIMCACDDDEDALRDGEYWVKAELRAVSEAEAAQRALDSKADDLSVTDKDCYHWYDDDEPAVFNLSQLEREQATLTAWNAGEPIRSEQ